MKSRAMVVLRLAMCATIIAVSGAQPLPVRAATTTWVVTGTIPYPPTCNVTLHRCRTIQAAVSAAGAGDYIAVAAGTYAEAITIDKSLTLLGAGTALSIIDVPETGGAYGITIADGVSSVTIRGLRIEGDGSSVIQEGGILIQAPATGVSTIVVRDNLFYGLDNGVEARGKLSSITVTGNTFDAIQDWTAIEATTLDMGSGLPYAIDGVTISDNEIKNSKTVPIKLSNYSSASGSTITNLAVTGNHIHDNNGDNNENWMGGVTLRHGATQVAITGNNIHDNVNLSGVNIAGAGTYDHLTISGNNLRNNTGVDRYPYDAAALAAGIKIVNITGPTTYSIASNAIAGNGRGLEWNGAFTLLAEYNWWGSDGGPGVGGNNGVLGNVDTDPHARALVTGVSGSTHEVGEPGTLTTRVTVSGVYGMQLRLSHYAAILTANGGATIDAPTGGWVWDWVEESFEPVTSPDGGRLSGSLRHDGHATPATLNDDPVADWAYICAGAGTSPLAYDTTTGALGSLLSDMDGFGIPAAYLGDRMTCLAATVAVSGTIELQGRDQDAVPNGWDDAIVTFACTAGACLTGGSPVATFRTGDDGVYVLDKSAPGLGLAPGTYDVTAWRHEYLSASKTGVVVGPGPLVMTTPRLLGGDANNDGRVFIGDMSCLGGAYGLSGPAMGDCGGKGSPDINGNGAVSIGDLSLAGGNYVRDTSDPWP